MKLGLQVLSYAHSDSFLSLRGSHSHTAGDVAIVLTFNGFAILCCCSDEVQSNLALTPEVLMGCLCC